MRRAVVIVDAASIGMGAMGLVFMMVGFHVLATSDEIDVDENLRQHVLDSQPLLVAVGVTRIVFSAFGAVGAVQLDPCRIRTALVGYAIGMIMALSNRSVLMVLVDALMMYPHLALLEEIREGIMTPATYPAENFCCV